MSLGLYVYPTTFPPGLGDDAEVAPSPHRMQVTTLHMSSLYVVALYFKISILKFSKSTQPELACKALLMHVLLHQEHQTVSQCLVRRPSPSRMGHPNGQFSTPAYHLVRFRMTILSLCGEAVPPTTPWAVQLGCDMGASDPERWGTTQVPLGSMAGPYR